MTTTTKKKQTGHTDDEAQVEAHLDAHPLRTVVEIREGIEATYGSKTERAQARLDSISKRRVIEKRPTELGRTAYRLSPARSKIKALDIEAKIWIIDGEVKLEVLGQGLDTDGLQGTQERLVGLLKNELAAKVLPLAEQVARALPAAPVVKAAPPVSEQSYAQEVCDQLEALRPSEPTVPVRTSSMFRGHGHPSPTPSSSSRARR
jgi:hypothetical protein